MQVQKISNNSTNFQARLEFVGDKRLLPKDAMKFIQEKAASLGTEKDKICIYLRQNKVFGPEIAEKNKLSAGTVIKTYTSFPSVGFVQGHRTTTIAGEQAERQTRSFGVINQFFNSIVNKINKYQ